MLLTPFDSYKLETQIYYIISPRVSQVRKGRCWVHELSDIKVWIHSHYSLWSLLNRNKTEAGRVVRVMEGNWEKESVSYLTIWLISDRAEAWAPLSHFHLSSGPSCGSLAMDKLRDQDRRCQKKISPPPEKHQISCASPPLLCLC